MSTRYDTYINDSDLGSHVSVTRSTDELEDIIPGMN